MDFKEKLVILRNANEPLVQFRKLATEPKRKVKSKEILSWINDIKTAVQRNKASTALAGARSIFLIVGTEEGLLHVRRGGLLRLSEYAFHAPLLANLVSDWIENASAYGINQVDLDYLRSAIAMYSLGEDLRARYLHIVATMKAKRSLVLKTLLSEVDSIYWHKHSHRSKALGLSDSITPEEVIEAYSYLLSA